MFIYILLVFSVCSIALFCSSPLCLNNGYNLNDKISKRNKRIFLINFILLALVSSLRYDLGVDYPGYERLYNYIKLGYEVYSEVGFNLIVKLIQITFDSKILMFAVFAFITQYIFLKVIKEQSKDYFLSFFLYLCMGYYFQTMNSIRYYVALAFVVYSVRFVEKRNYIKFIITVILGTLFHKTALIVIPIYFFAARKFKKGDYIFLGVCSIFLLLFSGSVRRILFHFYPVYLGSVYDGGSASLFNILKGIAVLSLSIIYLNKVKQNWCAEFYFKLNIIALIVFVTCWWIPEVSRIGYYFNFGSVILIPNLLAGIKDKTTRINITGIIMIAFLIYIYFVFLGSYSPTIALLPYKTWITLGSGAIN